MSKVYKMTDYIGKHAKAMDVAYFEGTQRTFPSLRSNPRPSAYDKYQEYLKEGEGGALSSNKTEQNNNKPTTASTESQEERLKKVTESLQRLKDTLSATAKALEEKNRQNKLRMEEERRKHNEKVKRDYKLNPKGPKK